MLDIQLDNFCQIIFVSSSSLDIHLLAIFDCVLPIRIFLCCVLYKLQSYPVSYPSHILSKSLSNHASPQLFTHTSDLSGIYVLTFGDVEREGRWGRGWGLGLVVRGGCVWKVGVYFRDKGTLLNLTCMICNIFWSDVQYLMVRSILACIFLRIGQ